MPIYYVASTGSNTSPYDTWAKAAPALATVAALSTAGDTIYVHGETYTISADVTYAFAGTSASPVRVICSNDKVNEPPQTLSTSGIIDGSGTTGVDISITGECYVYGLEFKTGGSSTAASIGLGNSDDKPCQFESCKFTISNTSATSAINIGGDTAANKFVATKYCTFTFGNSSGQGFTIGSNWISEGDTVAITTTVPTNLFEIAYRGVSVSMVDADLSAITTNLFVASGFSWNDVLIANSKLGSGVNVISTFTTLSHGNVLLVNCAADDEHYHIAHYNSRGSTVVSTGIYVADGAEYNAAAAKFSWKIVTTANCSFYTPYISPWVHTHNETTTAITPWLECMRDNSAGAVFQNDEVWAEFSYQGTSGSPLGILVNDRTALLAAAADQTASSKTASDWTGETGTPGFFKIGPAASITPAEIGPLSAHVVVGEPSITVYVDPQIRT